MVVSAADEAQLIWVFTKVFLIGKALGNGPAHKVLFLEITTAVGGDAFGILKVRELIGRPERSNDFGVALDLHHFDQWLEMATGAGIVGIDRLTRVVRRLEHIALRAI